MRVSIVLDCLDPPLLLPFWEVALEQNKTWGNDDFTVIAPPRGESGVVLILQRVPEKKSGKNRMHIDLHPGDVAAKRAELESLGATFKARNELPGSDTWWFMLLDPEGNEFCLVHDA